MDPQPTDPLASPYGFPLATRLEEFKKAKEAWDKSELRPTQQVQLQGKNQHLPILRVPINLPKYRLNNGRTSSAQVEYLATRPEAPSDLFTGDPEVYDAQVAQHDILVKLADKAELFEKFKNSNNHQTEALILDENGFVVNGNRRLCAWRKLFGDDETEYAHFSHIDVVVLPHVERKEIDKLEWRLQIEKDIRADYEWHAEANMLRRLMQAYGFDNKEMAKSSGMKDSELRDLLLMRDYAEEYLKSIGKENIWSLVSEDDFAFQRLVSGLDKLETPDQRELFKRATFVIIEKPERGSGSTYNIIRQIPSFYAPIEKGLQDAFQVTPQPLGESNGLDELFGGSKEATTSVSVELAKVITESDASKIKARDVITSIISTQLELEKDAEKESYLVNQTAKARTVLEQAVKLGLRPESSAKGVGAHLDEIEASVKTLREWLAQHAEN